MFLVCATCTLGLFARNHMLPPILEVCRNTQRAMLRDSTASLPKASSEWNVDRTENMVRARARDGGEMLFEADGSGLREAKLGTRRSPTPTFEITEHHMAEVGARFLTSLGNGIGDSKNYDVIELGQATQTLAMRRFIHGYPTPLNHFVKCSIFTGDILTYWGPPTFQCHRPGPILSREQAAEKLLQMTAKEKPGGAWRLDLINGPFWYHLNRETGFDRMKLPTKSFADANLRERILGDEAILVYLVEAISGQNRREICFGYIDAESGQVLLANWKDRRIRP